MMVHSQTYTRRSSARPRLATRTPQELAEQDHELGEYEQRVDKMTANVAVLEQRLAGLQEYRGVLLQVGHILQRDVRADLGAVQPACSGAITGPEGKDGQSIQDDFDDEEAGRPAGDLSVGHGMARFVVGVILRRKYIAFERVMWRAMRGNVYISKADIGSDAVESGKGPVDSATTAAPLSIDDSKCVFIVFAHGEAALGKIQKICEALGCRVFPEVNGDDGRRVEQLIHTDTQIDDLGSILFNTRQTRKSELAKLAESLEEQLAVVLQQKAIYGVMNLLHYDGNRKCLLGEAWCPTDCIPQVDAALHHSSERAGLDVSSILTVLKTDLSPPTHFPTNKFTQVFQDMSDAYGIANYREANPAIFMMITFPFLFSLMFGDVGHAVIMLLGAVGMIVLERRLASTAASSEIFSMIFSARYILLLMGLFSIYTGLIYNDAFCKSLWLFPSMFEYDATTGKSTQHTAGHVYPFGIDPMWNHAENGLNFTNSVKMKLSIVIAVLHMNLGLWVGATNFMAEGDVVSLCCRTLPQFLFFNSLFGYMALLIVVKWMNGVDRSILNTFIAMVMQMGAVDATGGAEFFPVQQLVQRCLFATAIVCVPWMVFARPVYFMLRKRRIEALGYQETNRHGSGDSLSSTAKKSNDTSHADDHESFGDQLIHEAIHAIEFVLGSVSNTASYLRLWALSLAHAQLSEVLWSMCLDAAMANPVAIVLGYGIWFGGTLAMMVAMEGLSAFLHALRLHWVEFNNKFYAGAGVRFEPFQLDSLTGTAVIVPAVQPVQY